ncbi:serine-rich adhesin for platelets-like [Ptychodera flava]|uniref:serine-rich adhesin for platelets-like n=1 Tax=Ptychodera flava TaxID=63121 RepID=UPI00396A377B
MSLHGIGSDEDSEKKRRCSCGPKLGRCMLSDTTQGIVLLTVVVVGYMCLGAAVFVELEEPEEHANETDVLWNVSLTLWNKSELDIESWVSLVNATLKINRHSYCDHEFDPMKQWSFLTALFLCMTAITTIGYGTVTPKSTTGRLFLTFYSVIGIPLFLMFLSNSGLAVAAKTRDCFKSVRKAAKETTRRLSHQISVRRNTRASLDDTESIRRRFGSYVDDSVEMTETEQSQQMVDELIEADYRRRSVEQEGGRSNPALEDEDGSLCTSLHVADDNDDTESAPTSTNGKVSTDGSVEKTKSSTDSPQSGDSTATNDGMSDEPSDPKINEDKVGTMDNDTSSSKCSPETEERADSKHTDREQSVINDATDRDYENLELGTLETSVDDRSNMQINSMQANSKGKSHGSCSEGDLTSTDQENNGIATHSNSPSSLDDDAVSASGALSRDGYDKDNPGETVDSSDREKEKSPERRRKIAVHSLQNGNQPYVTCKRDDGRVFLCNGPKSQAYGASDNRESYSNRCTASVEKPTVKNHGTAISLAANDVAESSRRSSAPPGIMRTSFTGLGIKCEKCGQRMLYPRAGTSRPKKKISFDADVIDKIEASSQNGDQDHSRSRADSFETIGTGNPHDRALSVLSVIYVIYTLGGSYLFKYWESEQDWDYGDSFYFCVTTLTTIGFGDLMLDLADGGQSLLAWKTVLFIIYTLVGLVLLSACFSLAQEKLKNFAHNAMAKLQITQYCHLCAGKCFHCCRRRSSRVKEPITHSESAEANIV